MERGQEKTAPSTHAVVAARVSPEEAANQSPIADDVLADVWSGISAPNDGPLFSDVMFDGVLNRRLHGAEFTAPPR
jgi:hypothetical protein